MPASRMLQQKTPGTLIGKLLDGYIVTDGVDRELLGDDTRQCDSFGFRMSIQMAEEDNARTRDGLKEF